MIGQRGIPASFGGVERHVEELGARLAGRGHEVTVFTRTNYTADRFDEYRGMRVRYLPTVTHKHFDAIVHSAISTISALADRFDILHYHAVGPGIPASIPRYLSPAKVVLTVHGLDAERAKWGGCARSALRAATWLSARVPHTTIVVSRSLAEHYALRYGRRARYIPNGVDPPTRRSPNEIRQRFGLRGGDYVLFVGRLVPEKAPDLLIRTFGRLPGNLRLVVAGGSSYTDEYVRYLQRLAAADPRVLLPGYVYGSTLEELYTNAAAFVLPSSLEGLPLTLLEAASYGTPVIASDIPPHVEVIGSDEPGQRLFRAGDGLGLLHALVRVLTDGNGERAGAEALRSRVLQTYSWDAAAEATEQAYVETLHGN
jgi:glycosyltransferase involved in cell wall biosynthesis